MQCEGIVINMKNREQRAVLLAVLNNRNEDEEKELNNIIQNELDWGMVGGILLHHRLSGYFINNLSENQKKYLSTEFKKTLELIVKAQKIATNENYKLLLPIFEEFEKNGIRYAALKGLVYNFTIYQAGYRRSNDSDLLVLEEDLDKLDKVLRSNGFIQCFSKSEFKEASRKAKFTQRLNHHDLVPYMKKIDGTIVSEMKIDINFHFDSKDNDISKEIYNYGTTIVSNGIFSLRMLRLETHLAHLCVHFYREATNSIWTSERRDVTLYKVIDIVNTLRMYLKDNNLLDWCNLMKKFGIQNQCYFTLYTLVQFYPDLIPKDLFKQLDINEEDIVNEIKISGRNERVIRDKSFYNSAFDMKYCIEFDKIIEE